MCMYVCLPLNYSCVIFFFAADDKKWHEIPDFARNFATKLFSWLGVILFGDASLLQHEELVKAAQDIEYYGR